MDIVNVLSRHALKLGFSNITLCEDTDHYVTKIEPTTIFFCGDNIDDRSLVFVLLHELKHLYQYKEGTLDLEVDGDMVKTIWKGRYYKSKGRLLVRDFDGCHYWLLEGGFIEAITAEEYDELPWEKEANEYARKCVKDIYKNKFKLNKGESL